MKRFPQLFAAAAGLLLVAALSSSCSDNTSQSQPAEGPPSATSTDDSGGYSGRYGDAGSGNGGGNSTGGSTGASVATVTQANYAFSPSKLTVEQGDAITVTDGTASTPHTFTIDGSDINVMNGPHGSQDVTIDLKPGTYTFYCTYHVSSGMKGVLTVT